MQPTIFKTLLPSKACSVFDALYSTFRWEFPNAIELIVVWKESLIIVWELFLFTLLGSLKLSSLSFSYQCDILAVIIYKKTKNLSTHCLNLIRLMKCYDHLIISCIVDFEIPCVSTDIIIIFYVLFAKKLNLGFLYCHLNNLFFMENTIGLTMGAWLPHNFR